MALDQRVDFAERMARRVARPGQMLGGVEHDDDGRGPRFRDDQLGVRLSARRLRHEVATEFVGLRHRGR